MAKKQQRLKVIGVEIHVSGHPRVTGLAATTPPASGDRYIVDFAAAVEVCPSRGDGWVGPLEVPIILTAADVDRLLAGLRSAGWSSAGWSPPA